MSFEQSAGHWRQLEAQQVAPKTLDFVDFVFPTV